MTIIQDFMKLDELVKRRTQVSAEINQLRDEHAALSERIRQASRIHALIDGVPCTAPYEDLLESHMRCETVAEAGQTTRTVLVYERANDPGSWAVQINAYGPEHLSSTGRHRWYGGKVLGLDKAWTAEEARTAAVRWLCAGEYDEY